MDHATDAFFLQDDQLVVLDANRQACQSLGYTRDELVGMTPLDFDPDALREKYRAERDRRLRPEANAQYVEAVGDFRHYIDDPYVDPGFTRLARDETVTVLDG